MICKIGKADMFVKLGGYATEEMISLQLFTKAMAIIAKSQFLWSKNSITTPFDTGVREVCFKMRKYSDHYSNL